MILREPPKLDKRSDKLNFIALSADMSQTDNQIILQQTLNDDTGINSGKVKVDSQSIKHVKLFILNKIFQNPFKLSLRNVFDSSMLDKLFQNSIENSLRSLNSRVTLFSGQT